MAASTFPACLSPPAIRREGTHRQSSASSSSSSTSSSFSMPMASASNLTSSKGAMTRPKSRIGYMHPSVLLGRFHRAGSSMAYRKRSQGPTCLMGGLDGGFWEGPDSGNNQFSPRNSTAKMEPSVLFSLIQEIEPLDTSAISKDASSQSTDAMKRTISGMLGLLPSDQFHVAIEVSWEPFARLLVSSMLTGYTLRNAEYRLCLQTNLESTKQCPEGNTIKGKCLNQKPQSKEGGDGMMTESLEQESVSCDVSSSFLEESIDREVASKDISIPQELGEVQPNVMSYIKYLQTKLFLVSKELEDCKLHNTGLHMQTFIEEEKNDLLDYLRSLEADKVAELSQPTSSEVETVIQQVIGRLFEELYPKLQSESSQFGNNTDCLKSTWEQDETEFAGTTPMQFQSLMLVKRDYLARLLFWCMLLGHHMRGLECRLELSRALSLSGDYELGITDS